MSTTTSDNYVPFYLAVFGKSNNGPPDTDLFFDSPVVGESKDSNNNDILSSSKENDNPRNGSRRVIFPTPEIPSNMTSPPSPSSNSRTVVPCLLSLDVQRPKCALPKESGNSSNIIPNKNIPQSLPLPKSHHPLNKNKNLPKKLGRYGKVNNDNSIQKMWRNDRKPNNNYNKNLPKPPTNLPITNTKIQNFTVGTTSFYFNNPTQVTSISIYQQKEKNSRQYSHDKSNMNHRNNKNGTNLGILKQGGMIKKKGISKRCNDHNNNSNGKYVNHRRTTNVFEMHKNNCNTTINIQQFNKDVGHASLRVESQPDKISTSCRKPLLPAPFTNQQ